MLLRSSSTPILNSCLHHSRDSSPEPEFHFLQRTISVSFNSSFHSVSSFDESASKKVINGSHVKPPRHHSCKQQQCKSEKEQQEEEAKPRSRIERLFSSSGLGDIPVKEWPGLQTLVEGGGSGGGRGGGGRRSDEDPDNDGSEFYSTDAYYERMISADPGNSLLLGNYAKFLKEVLN